MALVFPAEVRGVIVADLETGLGRVEAFGEHQPPRFLQTQLLLKLKRAHCRDGLEMGVEAGDAHADFASHVLDAKRLGEVLAQPLNGADHAMGVAANRGEMAHAMALFTGEQAVDDFPNHERPEHAVLLGRLTQAHEAQAGVEQIGSSALTAMAFTLLSLCRCTILIPPWSR